ncbi:MAG: 2-oxo acid dehydrogenase subunit E2 [Verrucomicrobia bacterium]|nr:2-oxo acid dehydrogenase subunit E2 [Verrucomicrobiota bacterium]
MASGTEKAKAAPKTQPSVAVESTSEAIGEGISAESGSATAAGLPLAASPSLRRIAFDLGVDLATIRGSESGGRVVISDLRRFIDRLKVAASRANADLPISRNGSQDASTPTKAVVSIPHVTQFDEADISTLLQLRKKWLPAYEAKGARITLTTLLLKAVAHTLKKFPNFNASLDESTQELVLKDYVHIGMAVDTDQGLLVPVLRNVDQKSLFELSKELNELAEKARDRKISLEEMKGGSFTISNQGAIGGGHFTPIVNKPEVAILGLGKTVLKPVVLKDQSVAARPFLCRIGSSVRELQRIGYHYLRISRHGPDQDRSSCAGVWPRWLCGSFLRGRSR